ncbi:hypothetical protein MRX96_036484 [Rhipicephalus microplus]
MGTASLQELFGLPSTFPWTPGPTLLMEPGPYYYVHWLYPLFPLFPSLRPCMVRAILYEVTLNQGTAWCPDLSPDVTRNCAPSCTPERQVVKRRNSRPPAEQGTDVVRCQATRPLFNERNVAKQPVKGRARRIHRAGSLTNAACCYRPLARRARQERRAKVPRT